MSNKIQRKSLEKILLVNWSRFAAEAIKINNSVLFAGANGTGKTTILDAVIYAVTGCKQFNKAADDKERTVLAYVRGDTKSTGGNRFLRSGAIVSYVALEFFSELENTRFVIGVYIESPDDISVKPYWFVKKDAAIDDFNFFARKDKKIIPTVKSELCVNGERLKNSFFLNQTNGVDQVLRALGLKNSKGSEYAGKLLRMMAIKPERDINTFIRESVLAEKPVKAIEQIREGRQGFDELKNKYNGIIKQKEMLEKLEDENLVYEKACRNAEIKQYIAYYQDLKSKEILKGLHQSKLENDNSRLQRLHDELEELEKEEKSALKAKNTAQRQYDEQDFDGNIRELERKSDELNAKIKHSEKDIYAIAELQKSVISLLNNPALGLSADDDKTLLKLNENIDPERKYSALLEFNNRIKKTAGSFRTSSVGLKQEIDKYDSEVGDLSNDIRKLENKKRTFPHDVEASRQKLQDKLRSQGLNIDVHILAELVTKVIMPEWQQAVECFMGRDRYALIVEDNYVAAARDAYKALGLNSPRLVLSDKIEPNDIKAASLASLLEIKSPEGRKYINYRFDHIHLCADMKELHDHSTGGITVDGYRATGHSMDRMDISKTNYTLGEDAIRLELDRKKSLRAEAEKILIEKTAQFNAINDIISILEDSDFKTDNYHFESISEIGHLKSELRSTKDTLNKLKNDPSFITLSQALKKANDEYDEARKMTLECSNNIAVYKNDIENTKKQIGEIAAEIFIAQNFLHEYELKHLDIKTAARDEYDKHISGHDDGILYSQNTIRRAETDRQKILEDLVKLQIKFCQAAGIDISKSGEMYIGYYRELKNELMNVKAEEIRQKLEDTSKSLESTFITDFVAQINENIKAARDEIDKINSELETLPFGNDVYKFKADERSDKAAFFRIAKQLNPIDNNQLSLFVGSNEALENNIKEFMDIILSDSSGADFEDYRSYLKYDMEIKNNKDESFDLSQKQGSASNGEKQTPFFIILAASLMQCYPRNVNCARLALIDEAFAALSGERIEQMVKYFEMNGFQVLYAAPPNKIQSIGSYISSTVSLVEAGRYTKAVEGLVDDIIERPE